MDESDFQLIHKQYALLLQGVAAARELAEVEDWDALMPLLPALQHGMDSLPGVAVNELDASQLMCWTEMANALQLAFAGLHPVLASRRASLALELQGLNNQGKLLRTYGG